jgi:hypothetical protein
MIPGSLARIYQPRIRQKAIRSRCQGSRNNLAGSGNTVLLTYVHSLSLSYYTSWVIDKLPAAPCSCRRAIRSHSGRTPAPSSHSSTGSSCCNPTALQRSQAYHNLLSSLRNLALRFPDHGYLRSNGPARRGGVQSAAESSGLQGLTSLGSDGTLGHWTLI